MNPTSDVLEIEAQGREGLVLDLALPVLAAWRRTSRVLAFRPSMGISGLNPREAARVRTLALATGARATGLFEGANEFRLGFSDEPEAESGIDADLSGYALPPIVSDLSIAAFGLPRGASATHHLQGFTHQRLASAHGYSARTLTRLSSQLGLDLAVRVDEPGFEPQGEGRITIEAARRSRTPSEIVSWKDRGELVGVHATLGGVRPRPEQFSRIEAELRQSFWEARRLEPSVAHLVSNEGDAGAFLQVDVEFERGGAAFLEMAPRQASPEAIARRVVARALAFCDGYAAGDEFTGPAAIAAAVAARAAFEIALVPSPTLDAAVALLNAVGAEITTGEAPGLTIVRVAPPRAPEDPSIAPPTTH